MSFEYVRLSEVCQQIRGVSYKANQVTDTPTEGYIPLLRANAIKEGELFYDDLVYVPDSIVQEKQVLSPGDILVAASSGSLSIVGKAAMVRERSNATFGAFCKVLRPNQRVDKDYFAHFFQTNIYKRYIQNCAAGANINNLKNEHFDDLIIPLPGLSEQRRVADILNKALTLIRKRRKSIAKLDELVQAVFLNMFGNPVQNSMQWNKVQLNSVITNVLSGWSVGGEEREKKSEELAVLKISAVTSGRFKPQHYKVVEKSIINKELVHPLAGDILFSRANTRELVGACCIVDRDYADLFLPDKLWKITLNEKLVSKEYFVSVLSNKSFKEEMSNRATGTSGSMLNISKAKLLDLYMPLPPIEKQQLYEQVVKKVRIQRTSAENQLEALENQFQSLLQRAFKGELSIHAEKVL